MKAASTIDNFNSVRVLADSIGLTHCGLRLRAAAGRNLRFLLSALRLTGRSRSHWSRCPS